MPTTSTGAIEDVTPVLTDYQLGWVVGFFEGKGSFCKVGRGGIFALEVFTTRQESIRQLQEFVGGQVITPPPAAPTRWTWRLNGKAAEALWETLRVRLGPELATRGDAKLEATR